MPGSTPMISPGVRVNVVDQSQYTALSGLPSNAFAIVGGAKFGPINVPTLITSARQFTQIFSTPADIAGLTAINTVSAGGTVYYCRFDDGTASKMSVSLDGTPGNLKIEATQKGSLLDGTWKVRASKGTDSTTFKLLVTRIPEGATEPIVMVAETELSFLSSDDNYYGNWSNDFFTASAADPNNAPTALTYTQPESNPTYVEKEFEAGKDGINSTFASNATGVKTALDVFSDRETYDIMYLTAPLYSTIADVAKEMQSIATSRKDCVVQIDCDPDPESTVYQDDSNKFSVGKVVEFFKNYTGTPYVGVWAGIGGYITDPYNNNAEVLAPVSAYLIPALAAEYASQPVWTAPASVANLNLTLLTKMTKVWTQDERDTLYAANINPITNYRGFGYTAMGQKSGQTTRSAMDRLNVVQLVNYLKVAIEKISVDFLFAPIDDETFNSWVYRVGELLNNVKTRRGLYDYKVKMDWETVTPDAINNNLLPGIVQIKPTKVAEFIDVDLVIKNYSDTIE